LESPEGVVTVHFALNAAMLCVLVSRHPAFVNFAVHISQKELPHLDLQLKLMLHGRIPCRHERYVPLHLLDKNTHFLQIALQIYGLPDDCTSLNGRRCFRVWLLAGLRNGERNCAE
jgi:hypothetical protein